MGTSTCPTCGKPVLSEHNYCPLCGTRILNPTLQEIDPGLIKPERAATLYQPSITSYPVEDVKRTKDGLLLRLIGTVLQPIPVVGGWIGGLIGALGAILVLLNRRAFGDKHSKYVVWSVGIYIFSAVSLFLAGLSFSAQVISVVRTSGSLSSAAGGIADATNGLLVTALIFGIMLELGVFLFTYGIQDEQGKILLWTGFLTSVIIGIIGFSIASSLITTAVRQALATGTYDPAPVSNLQSQTSWILLIRFIPALFFAGAFWVLRERVADEGSRLESETERLIRPVLS